MHATADIGHLLWLIGRALLVVLAFWCIIAATSVAFGTAPSLFPQRASRSGLERLVMWLSAVATIVVVGYSVRALSLAATWVPSAALIATSFVWLCVAYGTVARTAGTRPPLGRRRRDAEPPHSRRVEVRRARQRDQRGLVELVLAYIEFYDRPRPDRRQVEWLVQRVLDRPNDGCQFVAHSGRQMVGFATLYVTFSTLRAGKVALLNDLYVVPGFRREGVGTLLFEACLALVHDRGYAQMEWVTASDNRQAQALYEKLGAERGDWIQYSI